MCRINKEKESNKELERTRLVERRFHAFTVDKLGAGDQTKLNGCEQLELGQLRAFARVGQNVALVANVAHVADGVRHVRIQVARGRVQCALGVKIVLHLVDVPDY